MSITNWDSKNLSDIIKDSPEFNKMLSDACNGTARAQHSLGMWYQVQNMFSEAKKWYKKAANQDYQSSIEALAELEESIE